MLPFKVVYHPEYDLGVPDHIFPWHKYRLMRDALLREGIAAREDFLEPKPASVADLKRVHSAAWINALRRGTLRFSEITRLELPFSQRTVRACRLAAGGTTLAARMALLDGVGFHAGGGFHHAFRDHGEGFCAVHDAAVAVRRLQREERVSRVMIVDCDVHQGNGTASLFASDKNVFTLSIHQFNNYPAVKPPSDIDIHLGDQTGDEEYLDRLRRAYLPALSEFQPELLFYVAGADPYCEDQLGGLALTMEGLKTRDHLVLGAALERGVPVTVTLAGGYAADVDDTVLIHTNTLRAAMQELERVQRKPRLAAPAAECAQAASRNGGALKKVPLLSRCEER